MGRDDETLADRYQRTMNRLEQITAAGYRVEVMWECQFQDILARNPAIKTHPLVVVRPLRTRDALCGGRNNAMRLHYKVAPGKETIQYIDIRSLSVHL